MALYIPYSIFHLARLLYIRPENFGPYYVPSLKVIGQRNNEANRTSGNFQAVTAESFSVGKSSVSNVRKEVKMLRDHKALAIKLGDPDKDVGRTVCEFYDRRIFKSVKVTHSLSEKMYYTAPQGY
jgi:hypothetical protein